MNDQGLLVARWQTKTAVLEQLAANCLPLAGVLWLDWSVAAILILFWIENALLGLSYAALIPHLRPHRTVGRGHGTIEYQARNARFAVFAYFFFALIHGFFLVALFGVPLETMGQSWFALSILATAASRGGDLLDAWRNPRAFAQTENEWLGAAFVRVVLLQVVIVGGGVLAKMLGSPTAALAVLVILKSVGDLYSSFRRSGKQQPIR